MLTEEILRDTHPGILEQDDAMMSIGDALNMSLSQMNSANLYGAHYSEKRKNDATTQSESTINTPNGYWDWYYAPGNTIREWDEAHGIHLVRSRPGDMPRFCADREFITEGTETESTYQFKHRMFDKFLIGMYTFGQNQNDAKSVLNIAKTYCDNFDTVIEHYNGMGLYIWSKTKGSGKTMLSTIIGAELDRHGVRVRWYSMTGLLQEVKNSYDRNSGVSTADVIGDAKNAKLLILDDIGVERQSSWVNETVFHIIDERIRCGRPTIYTSNLNPSDLAYDERIIDRIRNSTEVVHMPEENVRQKFKEVNGFGEFLKG